MATIGHCFIWATVLVRFCEASLIFFASLDLLALVQVLGEEAQSSRLLLCEATRKALDFSGNPPIYPVQFNAANAASCRQVLLKSFELLGFTPLDKI